MVEIGLAAFRRHSPRPVLRSPLHRSGVETRAPLWLERVRADLQMVVGAGTLALDPRHYRPDRVV